MRVQRVNSSATQAEYKVIFQSTEEFDKYNVQQLADEIEPHNFGARLIGGAKVGSDYSLDLLIYID